MLVNLDQDISARTPTSLVASAWLAGFWSIFPLPARDLINLHAVHYLRKEKYTFDAFACQAPKIMC